MPLELEVPGPNEKAMEAESLAGSEACEQDTRVKCPEAVLVSMLPVCTQSRKMAHWQEYVWVADDQACYPKASYSGSARKKDAFKKELVGLLLVRTLPGKRSTSHHVSRC